MTKWLLMVVFLCWLTPLSAQDPFSSSSEKTEKTGSKLTFPLPGQLETGWWTYFDVSGELLDQRIKTAERLYYQKLNDISPDQNELATQLVKQILSHLKSLQIVTQQSQEQSTSITSSSEPFKNEYSIDEWLAFAAQLKSEQIDFADQQSRVTREQDDIKAAKKQINSMMLTYMDVSEGTTQKFMAGLELIAKRSFNAVRVAQLKLDKIALQEQGRQLNQMLEFNRLIFSRLTVTQSFLNQLKQKLEKSKQKHLLISKKVTEAQADTIGLVAKEPLAKATSRLRDQQVLNERINEAISALKIAALQAEHDLATLLYDRDFSAFGAMNLRLNEARELIELYQQKAAEWRLDTTNELAKAQTAIISLSVTDPVPSLEKVLKQRIELTQVSLTNLKQIEVEQEKLLILIDETTSRIKQKSGTWGAIFNWGSIQANEFKTEVIQWWTEPLFEIGDTPVTALGLLRVIFIVALANFISWLLRKALKRIAAQENLYKGSASAIYTVGRLTHYLILLVGIIIALASIGLDFTNLALVAGALSVGIGFGLQSIVNNFVSGLILLFERSLKVGDFVELESGLNGLVKEINVRSTLINTNDNVDIIVPNSLLVSNKVTNWTLREANRRIHVPFGVAYGTNKDLVKKAVLEAASRVPYTHKIRRGDAVQCWLVGFGDSSLDFELVVWINQEAVRKPGTVQAAYMWEIETSLHEHGIEIPFPQRDLHVRSFMGHRNFEPPKQWFPSNSGTQ